MSALAAPPVPAAILRLAGRPAAVKVYVTAVVGADVAVTVTGVIATPCSDCSVAGALTVTTFVTFQAKVAPPAGDPVPSVTVTVTVAGPTVVGVPLMMPVAVSMLRPAGRPAAA